MKKAREKIEQREDKKRKIKKRSKQGTKKRKTSEGTQKYQFSLFGATF